MLKKPLISIITVSFNAEHTIERAFLSVFSQKKNLYEYIVIDGQSTDGTVRIIDKYNDNIDVFISEKDSGIYDAMNKGLSLATGKWILFLGADDELLPGVIAKIEEHLICGLAAVFGKVQFDNGRVMSSFVSWRTYVQNTIHHQSVFYNAELFRKFKYDTSLKAISDYELNLIIWVKKMKYKKVDLIISECYSSGTSSDFDLSLKETNRVRQKVVTSSTFNKALSFILYAYYWQKKVRKVSLAG